MRVRRLLCLALITMLAVSGCGEKEQNTQTASQQSQSQSGDNNANTTSQSGDETNNGGNSDSSDESNDTSTDNMTEEDANPKGATIKEPSEDKSNSKGSKQGGSNNAKDAKDAGKKEGKKVSEGVASSIKKSKFVKDISVEKTYKLKGYNSNDTYYFMLIKNKSKKPLKVNIHENALGEDNSVLHNGEGTVRALEKNRETIVPFFLGNVNANAIKKIDYDINAEEEKEFKPCQSQISYKVKKNEDGIKITAQNKGKDDIDYLKFVVLFFKKGNLVYHGTTFVGNGKYTLRAGKKMSGEIKSAVKYDDVKVYYTCRK